MTFLNGLVLLNLAIALLALVRSRPGALMIALNQVGTLRALDNIRSFGEPASEAFLPGIIFSSRNLDVAANIFALSTLILGVSLLVPSASPGASTRRAVFPPLPRWLLGLLLIYVVITTISSGNLLTHAYVNEAGAVFGVGLGGLNALMFSLCTYEVVRRSLVGQWSPLAGFLALSAVLFLTNYSKGSTGLATGYGMSAALMLWPTEAKTRLRRVLITGALVASVGLMAFVVRGIRTVFFERGINSVAGYLQTNQQESERSRAGEGIESSGNGTQYACHTLECIELYESGISRDWRSIYNPIIYTFEPSFLLRPLDLTRPREAAWELADYYIHGGGIYLLGELYWNGGYLCVCVVFGLLAWLTFYCDTRFRRSAFWLMMCSQLVPGLFMGVGYGFAQVIRGAINGLLVVAAYRWIPHFRLGLGPRRIPQPRVI